jgi:hypothetical protein
MTGSLSFARVEPVVLKVTSEGLYEIPEKSWNGNRGQDLSSAATLQGIRLML